MAERVTFREAVESRDRDALSAALSPDVVFHSPAVFAPYVGRDETMRVLGAVLQVFEEFRYIDEMSSGPVTTLRFVATVNGRSIEGVDLVRHDDGGLVVDLTVMIRPLSALLAVVEAMAAQLGAAPDAVRPR